MYKLIIILLIVIAMPFSVFSQSSSYDKKLIAIEKKYQGIIEKIEGKFLKEIKRIEDSPRYESEMTGFLKKVAQERKDIDIKQATSNKKFLMRQEVERQEVLARIKERKKQEKELLEQQKQEEIKAKEAELRELKKNQ